MLFAVTFSHGSASHGSLSMVLQERLVVLGEIIAALLIF